MSLLSLVVIVVVGTVLLPGAIRVAREDERLAVFSLGRYAGLRGPGLVLLAPAIMRAHRLRLGDVGTLESRGLARFDKVAVPVSDSGRIGIGQPVRIDGFDVAELRIAESATRATQHCPKCGHRF